MNADCNSKLLDKLNLDEINVIEEYYQMIEKIVKLASKFNFKTAFEISNLFSYLLWNGYLSIDNEFCYMIQDKCIPKYYGLNIMAGSGVCLNNSEMLNDILNQSGFISYVADCKMNSVKLKYPNIERKNCNQNKRISFLTKINNSFFPNHAIVLVKDNDMIFAYDSTNLSVLKIKDYKATIVNGKGNMKLFSILDTASNKMNISEKYISYLNALCFLVRNNIVDEFYVMLDLLTKIETCEKFLDVLNIFNGCNICYSEEFVLSSMHSCFDFLGNNKDILNEFYEDCHYHIDVINSYVKRINSNKKMFK